MFIDGIDISTLKLHSLRRRIFTIAQGPYLFQGSLRTMLDPDGVFHDERLQEALGSVRFFTNDLSFTINEGGTNISQGQRQTLCLARALLSRRKLIIMDEATSAVDTNTDVAIQEALKDALPDSTLIVVAHRLATVAGFDKILVLEGGRLVEFGALIQLYQQKGAFWKLVCHSPDGDALAKRMMTDRASSH
ncbi:P-loop containing nucleoside triphosphate hydrolase protein [Cercophora newfieldiana]|uniref:P-loop containing nucleoside triphosphate hydrolase protein n=1 Tax=Cercophora newfieldiana TaxID=92897 RepID=A0AA40CLU1_9PEZI|nr:P-loop containing nucleoside triphosphate hydrolase protein [Cercophora newfieldiana]